MTGARYRIVVRGEFDEITAASFEDVVLTRSEGVTVLQTDPLDQPALFGLLQRIQTVGAGLVALSGSDDPDDDATAPDATAPDEAGHRPERTLAPRAT